MSYSPHHNRWSFAPVTYFRYHQSDSGMANYPNIPDTYLLTLPNGQQVTAKMYERVIRCRAGDGRGPFIGCGATQDQLVQMIYQQYGVQLPMDDDAPMNAPPQVMAPQRYVITLDNGHQVMAELSPNGIRCRASDDRGPFIACGANQDTLRQLINEQYGVRV